MKLEAFEEAVRTARKKALHLDDKAKEFAIVARAAKDRARQAKGKLKLARQQAKQARKASKDAKRAFAKVRSEAEGAVVRVARLEKKLKRAHKQVRPPRVKKGNPKKAGGRRRVTSKNRTAAPSLTRAKSSARHIAPARPANRLGSKPAQRTAVIPAANIEVPRDFAPKPAAVPADGPAQSGASSLPIMDTGKLPQLP